MMPDRLPPAVQLHVNDMVRRTDWAAIAAQTDHLCDGCPGRDSDDDPPPCYACPLWALRLDLAQLRLLRRLELGS